MAQRTGSGSGSPASARRAHSAPARARPASRQPTSDPTSERSKPPPPAPGPRRCRKAFLPQSPTSLRRAPARGRGRPAAVATRSRGCCCCCRHRRRAGPERRRRRGRGRRAGGRSGPGGRSPGAGALGGRRRGRSRTRTAPAPYGSAVAPGRRRPPKPRLRPHRTPGEGLACGRRSALDTAGEGHDCVAPCRAGDGPRSQVLRACNGRAKDGARSATHRHQGHRKCSTSLALSHPPPSTPALLSGRASGLHTEPWRSPWSGSKLQSSEVASSSPAGLRSSRPQGPGKPDWQQQGLEPGAHGAAPLA